MKKFKLGLIGAGHFGSFLIEGYQKLKEVKIIALCDRDEKKLKKITSLHGIKKYYLDYLKMLQDPEIEIVVIATPPFLHTQMAISAASFKKHLLLEKPLALSLKEGERIKKAVLKNKVKFNIDYVMRYNPLYQKAKEIIEKEILGKLSRIFFENYASYELLPPSHWFWDEKKSGGIFVEHGIHFFDIFNWLIGQRPKKIWAHQIDKNRVFSLIFYPDVSLSFYHAFDLPKYENEKTLAHFAFEKGYLTLSGWIPTKLEIEGKETIDLGQKEKVYEKATQMALLDLIEAIQNPSHKMKVSLEDALESLKLALLSQKSASLGKIIEL